MARSNPYTACDDCHRTDARPRQAAVSRRRFLSLGIGAGVTLYTARALPLQHWLEGAQQAAAQAPQAPVLVSVFLPGGLDLLDTLVPLGQYGAYSGYRGAEAQPEATTPRLGSTGLGIHPSLTKGDGDGIKGLFDRGRIGFLPGIDYANPDLSHFHSRHFWETGLITASSATGWLGRWLDVNGAKDNPFQGLTSGFRLSPTLVSAGAPVCSVESVTGADLSVFGQSAASQELAMRAWTDLAFPRAKDGPGRTSVRSAARFAQQVADQLRPLKGSAPAPTSSGGDLSVPLLDPQQSGYPSTALGSSLRQLAFLLAQPLGIRTATVDSNGAFDTHAGQAATLTNLLADVSRSLAAFQADLEARGLGDRVLTFVWSEFGRRPKANQSGGTDHGAGGIAWVQGVRAAGGVLSEYPDLGATDDKGNLRVTVDFRQVYASLIEQWLGTDAAAVIPNAGAFSRVGIVR